MSFIPPFCPNPACTNHTQPNLTGSKKLWYYRRGFFKTQRYIRVNRFTCKCCWKTFSERTFQLDYHDKLDVPYRDVFQALVSCQGIRQIARTMGTNDKVIARRISKLSPQALALHARFLDKVKPEATQVYGGMESFSYSKYFPNNINLMCGKKSQAVFAFGFSHIRHKGRTTAIQKAKQVELDAKWSTPKDEILKSTVKLIKVIAEKLQAHHEILMTVISDGNPAYVRAFKESGLVGFLKHIRISSKLPRTRGSPLFTLNYLERQLRKDQSEHVRETSRVARRSEKQMERIAIYLAYHNFHKPFREKGSKSFLTHAQVAGMDATWVKDEFDKMLKERRFGKREPLEWFHKMVWNREYKNPLLHSVPMPGYLKAD